MEPSEVVYDWGTLTPGQRIDVYPEKKAVVTLTEARRLTVKLENFQDFSSFNCWIQIGSTHYFPTDENPVHDFPVPIGTHDFYFDCTAFVNSGVTEAVSGEVLLRVLDGDVEVGIVRVKYAVTVEGKGFLEIHAYLTSG